MVTVFFFFVLLAMKKLCGDEKKIFSFIFLNLLRLLDVIITANDTVQLNRIKKLFKLWWLFFCFFPEKNFSDIIEH